MIAEHVADRYLVAPLEVSTPNRPILAFSLMFLSPTRSFANLMAFKYPWHREGRLGISGENNKLRTETLRDYEDGAGPALFEYTPPKKRSGEATIIRSRPPSSSKLRALRNFPGWRKLYRWREAPVPFENQAVVATDNGS